MAGNWRRVKRAGGGHGCPRRGGALEWLIKVERKMTKGNDQRRLRWLDLPHESVKRGTQKGILSLSLFFSLSLLVKSDAYLTLCYTISNVLSNEFYCFIEHGESNEILVGYFIVEVVAR